MKCLLKGEGLVCTGGYFVLSSLIGFAVFVCCYRKGYTVKEWKQVPPCIFNIVPSTFEPGLLGPFFIDVASSHPFRIAKV